MRKYKISFYTKLLVFLASVRGWARMYAVFLRLAKNMQVAYGDQINLSVTASVYIPEEFSQPLSFEHSKPKMTLNGESLTEEDNDENHDH